jgi:hypothetical protein
MPIRETMRTPINGSSYLLLVIVGMCLWTIATVAFQLQHRHAAKSNSRKFMRRGRVYSSEIDGDDEDDDVPMIVRAPERESENFFSREKHERKRGDFEAGQSYGGRSLASTLVRSHSQMRHPPIPIAAPPPFIAHTHRTRKKRRTSPERGGNRGRSRSSVTGDRPTPPWRTRRAPSSTRRGQGPTASSWTCSCSSAAPWSFSTAPAPMRIPAC